MQTNVNESFDSPPFHLGKFFNSPYSIFNPQFSKKGLAMATVAFSHFYKIPVVLRRGIYPTKPVLKAFFLYFVTYLSEFLSNFNAYTLVFLHFSFTFQKF